MRARARVVIKTSCCLPEGNEEETNTQFVSVTLGYLYLPAAVSHRCSRRYPRLDDTASGVDHRLYSPSFAATDLAAAIPARLPGSVGTVTFSGNFAAAATT